MRMLRESLKTRDHTTALKRWPDAMQRLRARASGETKTTVLPMKPTDTGVEWDIPTLPDGTNDYDNAKPRVVTAAELLEPEDFEIDWSRAWEIHAQRKEAKTGRALADSTRRSARNVWTDLGIGHPAAVTVADIRNHVAELQKKKYAATSIMQRCGLLAAITTSLIKTGWLGENCSNPWDKVDTSAKRVNHHRPATPEEIRKLLKEVTSPGVNLAIKLMVYEGMRIGEVSSRTPGHLVDGELIINATDKWRPKSSHSERTLPAPDWCVSLPVKFPQRTAINGWIHRVLDNDLTSHGLRGAWRTATREAGISTEMAEHLMGHAQDSELIDTYGEFNSTAKRAAMEQVWAVLDEWIK